MTDIHNNVNKNSIYRTKYLVNNGKNGNIYNFKNKKSSKIKLLNDNNNILMALKNKI
jgi:general stress protein 26